MNEKVRTKALSTLDGMAEIIRRERIVKGEYATEVDDPKKSDAVCQGRRYCLLGSAWVAYGAKVDKFWGTLEGVVEDDERADYLRHRPALRAVYNALNNAATRKIEKLPRLTPTQQHRLRQFPSPAEGLFESLYGSTKLGRTDLLRLVASARREIKAA